MPIQICPALMDWLVFLVLFAVLYGAGERGLSISQCAWLGGLFQIIYMATSPLVGGMLSRRNARAFLLGSTVAAMFLGAAALMLQAFWPLLLVLALLGSALAVFFNAFQTFMRGETVPGGLARTVAHYTLAWSLGSSLGFLSSGFFYRLGAGAMATLNVAVSGTVLVVLLGARARPQRESSADEHVEESTGKGRPVDPGYVLVGWCIIFTAMFVQRPIQNFFPAICARQGITPFIAGLPLFLHMFVQGWAGYACLRFRPWLYRRTPLWLMNIGAGLLCLGLWRRGASLPMAFIGISALGMYAGFAYFSAVYYASNSGRRSFNIGVNECLVGLGSFAGLFASEWWMRRSGSDLGLYLVCAVLLFVSAVVQVVVATRAARRQRQGL